MLLSRVTYSSESRVRKSLDQFCSWQSDATIGLLSKALKPNNCSGARHWPILSFLVLQVRSNWIIAQKTNGETILLTKGFDHRHWGLICRTTKDRIGQCLALLKSPMVASLCQLQNSNQCPPSHRHWVITWAADHPHHGQGTHSNCYGCGAWCRREMKVTIHWQLRNKKGFYLRAVLSTRNHTK